MLTPTSPPPRVRGARGAIIATMCLSLAAASVHAQALWTSNGVPVCVMPECGGRVPFICGDGAGGALIAWLTDRDGNEDIYVRRVLASGLLAPGWPVIGTPATRAVGNQYLADLVPDSGGGAFVAWYDWPNYDVYVQHVLGNGQIAPGWPANGLQLALTSGSQLDPRLLPDGDGGVFIVWEDGDLYVSKSDVFAQHLNSDGTRVEGWPEGGLAVCTAPGLQGGVYLVGDGERGVITAWGDGRNYYYGEFFAQRITWSGNLVDGWPVDGKRVIPAGTAGGLRGMVPDGAGGAYMAWQHQEDPYYSDAEVYAVRMLSDGSVAPGWPAGGRRLTAGVGYQQLMRAVSDSLGGVLVCWFDSFQQPSGAYVTRLRPDGTEATGWTAGGTRVSDILGWQLDPVLAPDGSGGAYVALLIQTAHNHGYVQHFTASGAPALGWPASGVPVAVPTEFYAFQQNELAITQDQRGGAIVAWNDARNGIQNQIYAQRYLGDGPTPAVVSLVSAQALPGRVALTWHDPARVVSDAAVERRREHEGWAAIGRASFDGGGRARFEDAGVAPGARYAYRLGWAEPGGTRFSAETWVDVPAALAFALEGARPNPAAGPISVAFTLTGSESATLELLDVAGRQLLAREVGGFGPGSHVIRLGECGCTPPGMYWLRLAQAGRSLVKRLAVVR